MQPDEFTGGPVLAWSANDPAPPGPLPYADIGNPQSLNKYAYTYNNPVKFTDPDGHVADIIWDAFNVGIGLYSAYQNVKAGNYTSAAIDVGGAALDSVAAVVPFVPGGAGTTIKLARAANKIDNATDAAKTEKKVVEGIYEFNDATSPGRKYVGQSGDVESRVRRHTSSGKRDPNSNVNVTPVKGGKTKRELAESHRIDELGGTRNNPNSQTSNVKRPVSKKREEQIRRQNGQDK